jgi:hypothetical protein
VDDLRTESDADAGEMPDSPGWYPDPNNPDALKHWNGTEWSDSLFDDVTSVAALESRDPVLFLDDVDPPARVALPKPPSVAEEATPPPPPPAATESEPPAEPESEPDSDNDAEAAVLLGAGAPKETWDVPKRSPIIRTVIVAASVLALVAIGVLMWQTVSDDGESASEAVVTDDSAEAEAAEAEAAEEVAPAEPTTVPSPEPAETSPNDAVETADDPAEAEEEEAAADPDPEAAPPLLASAEVNLIPDAATIRSGPRLDSDELGVVEQSETLEIIAVGHPIDGWRAIEGTGGWIWGAFVAPAAADQIVARTLTEAPAILRDEAGIPTGNPNLGGAYVLIVDGGQPLWKIILPEGGFAYVRDVEFELILE